MIHLFHKNMMKRRDGNYWRLTGTVDPSLGPLSHTIDSLKTKKEEEKLISGKMKSSNDIWDSCTVRRLFLSVELTIKLVGVDKGGKGGKRGEKGK